MMYDKIIFIPTVQHTGTWFVIDLLRSHSKVNDEVVHFSKVINGSLEESDKYTIVNTHIGVYNGGGGVHKADVLKHQHPLVVSAMANTYPTVIPLRDPLRSLITRDARHPDLCHKYIVDGFVFLSDLYFEGYDDIEFVPIDSLTWYSRCRLVERVFRMLGLKLEKAVDEYMHSWKAPDYNISEDSNLKRAYNSRRMLDIEKELKEVPYLLSNQEAILPLLDKYHYNDLIWDTRDGNEKNKQR